MRFLLALLALAGAAQAQTRTQTAFLAGERGVLFPKRHAAPPPAGWTQPSVTALAKAIGDSRTQKAGGWTYASPTASITAQFDAGYAGWLYMLDGSDILAGQGWNYGVGAQTSAGILGRMQTARTDCNNDTATFTAPCFTGVKTTTTAATVTGGTSIAVSSVAGVAVGDYISIAGVVLPYSATVGAISGSTVTISGGAFTGVAASGSTIVFSHPSLSSNFAAYIGAGAPASVTDVSNNAQSDGVYSPVAHPAHIAFLLDGVNDGGWTFSSTAYQAMTDIAATLDALGPNGANNMVVLSDEVPTGAQTAGSVLNGANGAPSVYTIPSTSPYTVTVGNASAYMDTAQVFYVPALGTSGVADGANLTNCTTNTNAAPKGTAACAPSTGQYSVTNGVYTFAAGDSGRAIAIYYRANTQYYNLGPSYLTQLHGWLASTTCTGSYTDPGSTITYPINPPSCNRPWVKIAPTWEAVVDPSTTSPAVSWAASTNVPLPYMSVDALHFLPAGGQGIANAMLQTAIAAGWAPTTPTYPLPATASLNNVAFTGSTTTSTAAQTTTCTSATGPTTKNYFINTLTPAASTGQYTVGTKLYGYYGTNPGMTAGSTITCVDTANNLVQMSTPATATSSYAAGSMFQADATSFLTDGVFHYTELNAASAPAICGGATTLANCATPSLGTTVAKGLPAGNWALSDASTGGALTAAITAGTFKLAVGVEQNPLGDGFDDLVLVGSGYASTGSPGITLSSTIVTQQLAAYTAGDLHRAQCEVKISAGPNGHLYGLTGPWVKISDVTSTSNYFAPPGATAATYTTMNATGGGGGTTFSDQNLAAGMPNVANGVLTLDLVSPPSTVEPGSTSTTVSFGVTMPSSDPVSFTARFRRCWAGKAANG